jgi:repressor LexA
MTVTVLHGTWTLEVDPARKSQAPNAVYVRVRHKPLRGTAELPPDGIRFGLTEADVLRIAKALVSATVGDRADDVLHEMRAEARNPAPPPAAKEPRSESPPTPAFTKTQGRYLLFIHRYMKKFGCAPAEADIQCHFLVSAPSVNAMMQTLTRKKLIARLPGVARSIRLLVPPEQLPLD